VSVVVDVLVGIDTLVVGIIGVSVVVGYKAVKPQISEYKNFLKILGGGK
jgi:ABC-type phosphate transport system permease subunit